MSSPIEFEGPLRSMPHRSKSEVYLHIGGIAGTNNNAVLVDRAEIERLGLYLEELWEKPPAQIMQPADPPHDCTKDWRYRKAT